MQLLSPLEMMYKWESEIPGNLFLRQPFNRENIDFSWKDATTEVRKMAAALKNLNLPPQSKIAILSKNCAHWILSDLAIMMSGNISVPLYPNLSEDTVRQILEHSETKVLFLGKLDDDKFTEMVRGIPSDVLNITYPLYPHQGYTGWNDFIKDVEPLTVNLVRDPEELASIIYTSGTTGMPKGVMHTFKNFSFAATHALNLIKIGNESKFFSYLPLCHIAERLLVEMGGLYSGGSISFAESLETFPADLSNTQPTIFLGVPRIWTKFQEGVLKNMPQKKLDLFLKIPILSGIVKKKIQTKLGLLEAKNTFTGAAPTPAALIEWFGKLGINIQEAYAMTENCCYSHVTLNDKIKIGYVGQALPYCDVKLSDEGEILVKHEALMKGYYKEPSLTRETFMDGYLRTGDKGLIDPAGYLKITGRVKDLFKTSKGKYVAPSPIEMKISANPLVEQVCVVGSGLPQPIALVVVSQSENKGTDKELATELERQINELNKQLDHHETIKKVVVMNSDWTVENGLLTPTMKIKRNVLEQKYGSHYKEWYDKPEKTIFL